VYGIEKSEDPSIELGEIHDEPMDQLLLNELMFSYFLPTDGSENGEAEEE